VRELSAEENALFAIIENMQREDLNPVEEASAFKSIIDTFGFTQDEVAKSVGKSRPYVANTLRILKLPESIQGHLSGGTLTAGHANALGAVKDTEKMQVLAEQIVREGMSVRQAELIATRISGGEGAEAKRREAKPAKKNPAVLHIEEELTSLLGTRVTLGSDGRKGMIEIHYYSKDELDGLIDMLRKVGG
jgi:ParB family chromosome partitioning protein